MSIVIWIILIYSNNIKVFFRTSIQADHSLCTVRWAGTERRKINERYQRPSTNFAKLKFFSWLTDVHFYYSLYASTLFN